MAMFKTSDTTKKSTNQDNINDEEVLSVNDSTSFKSNNKQSNPLFENKNQHTLFNAKHLEEKHKPKKTKFKRASKRKLAKPFKKHKAKKTFLDDTNIVRRTPEIEGGYYVLRDNSYMKFLQVNSKDILSRNNHEQIVDMGVMLNLLKTYSKDNKLLSMNIPTDTEKQRLNLQYTLNKTDNLMHKHFLQDAIERLEFIEESSRMERSFLIMLFGTTSKELQMNIEITRGALSSAFPTQKLTYEHEKKILRKFNNQVEEIK